MTRQTPRQYAFYVLYYFVDNLKVVFAVMFGATALFALISFLMKVHS